MRNTRAKTMKTSVKKLVIIWSVIVSQVHLDKINAPGCGFAPPQGRIYNGRRIDRRFVPWIVHLSSDIFVEGHGNVKFHGAGSLISKHYVLTAAQLVQDNHRKAHVVHVRFNATHVEDPPTVIAAEVITHPRYNKTTAQNDIALVKLPHPLRFDKFVKPVCLPTHRLHLNHRKAFTAGWGTSSDAGKETGWLSLVTLKILPYRLCPRKFHTASQKGYFTKADILCTKARGKNTCTGDAGVPLVVWNKRHHRFLEVGILAFGLSDRCENAMGPDIFTRVSTFVPWIQKVIAGHRTHRNYWETSSGESGDSMFY